MIGPVKISGGLYWIDSLDKNLGGNAMAKKTTSTRKVARSAITGKFVPMKYAKKNPKTTVIETVKTKKK